MQYAEMKGGQWKQNDTLFFTIDSTDIEVGISYDLSLEVTNNISYPYSNIWFFVQSDFQNDSIFAHTAKEYQLADEYGKWEGSGFGSLYQLSCPFERVIFKERRNYHIKIEHGMRDEPLIGIEKVGVKLISIEK